MIIVKKGYWHMEYGTNCQDAATEFVIPSETIMQAPKDLGVANNGKDIIFKCIVDGCSEGENSEVGAKLFTHMFKEYTNISMVFERLTEIFREPNDILNHLLFTILYVIETEHHFYARVCGDGYIILQDHNDKITYEKFEYGGAPPYYAYNYFPKDKLKKYKEGVDFIDLTFNKSQYKAVGVASDGLQYILDSGYKKEFEELLVAGKPFPLKRFINRNAIICKDDLSIAI